MNLDEAGHDEWVDAYAEKVMVPDLYEEGSEYLQREV
jgi:hypothetical protein